MFTKTVLTAASLCFSYVGASQNVIHEKLVAVPKGCTQVGTPSANQTMVLQIALAQQNLDQLEFKLQSLSSPGSKDYGKYMERDAVASMFAPPAEANAAVLSWLKSHGVRDAVSDGSYVNLSSTVGTVNGMLSTKFHYYDCLGVRKLRTTHYSIPRHLMPLVDLISPTIYFGETQAARRSIRKETAPRLKVVPRKLNSSVPIDPSCAQAITPACLKTIYNIDYQANANSGSRIGFGSFLNESVRVVDLLSFEKGFNISQQNISVQLINGGVNDQAYSDNHLEANLDVEYIAGIASPLPIISYIVGGSPPFVPNVDEPTAADNMNEAYLNYFQYLLGQTNENLPDVISNSYGDDEQTVPEKYARRVCNMIGMLGLRGVSVLFSSGDTGVGAACISNDGKQTLQFTPAFPASCPWVTTVGGTQSIDPEIAWEDSSGGFSNYFCQPEYQKSAVAAYLQTPTGSNAQREFANYADFSKRGFPDVAAHSLDPAYQVFINNARGWTGGTSASSPVFASIIALLNDGRFRAGMPPLGFLNPWLYSIGLQGLTDITAGGSVGCNGVNGQTGAVVPGGGVIPGAMWNATRGWDPVTGLGVPDFGRLMALALGR